MSHDLTALYERLSHDDEKSKGRKAKLFFSASIGDAVFALLNSPDKFVVDGNALFLTLAAAPIANVKERKGRLDLPIVSGKHLRRISDRTALQSADNAEKFITTRKIDSFENLAKMYALYAPIQAAYKESQSLKGFAKMRYDKEHKDSLSKYPELKERMQSLLQNGEKITPKQWKAEIQSLQSECNSIGKEQTKTATELAYAEVISYNRKNLERELQNESRQQSRTKWREEEI